MKILSTALMSAALLALTAAANAQHQAPVLASAQGVVVEAPGVSVIADPNGVIVEAPGASVSTTPLAPAHAAPSVIVEEPQVLQYAPAPQPALLVAAPEFPTQIGLRCVTYHDHKRLFKLCKARGCGSRVDVVSIRDPRCGDCIDLPICVPGMCHDEPVISSRKRLLLGGSVAVVRYRNGFVVKVIIDRKGDVSVHSFS